MNPHDDSGAPNPDRAPEPSPQEAEVQIEVDAPETPALESAEPGALEQQLAAAEERARAAEAKLADEHDRLLRAAADLDNARKRAARERDETQKFAVERLVKDLVPVIDNLDRALAAAPEGDPLSGGVKLVRRIFEEALAKHGVEILDALGQPFDPRHHEALAQRPDADHAPGTVVDQHGRAFLLHGRLVRPAMVAVATAPPAPAADDGPDAGAAGADTESEAGKTHG